MIKISQFSTFSDVWLHNSHGTNFQGTSCFNIKNQLHPEFLFSMKYSFIRVHLIQKLENDWKDDLVLWEDRKKNESFIEVFSIFPCF